MSLYHHKLLYDSHVIAATVLYNVGRKSKLPFPLFCFMMIVVDVDHGCTPLTVFASPFHIYCSIDCSQQQILFFSYILTFM